MTTARDCVHATIHASSAACEDLRTLSVWSPKRRGLSEDSHRSAPQKTVDPRPATRRAHKGRETQRGASPPIQVPLTGLPTVLALVSIPSTAGEHMPERRRPETFYTVDDLTD